MSGRVSVQGAPLRLGLQKRTGLATPTADRALSLAHQQESEQLRGHLTALATELASLRDLIGRNSLNASKLPPQRWPRPPLQHRAAVGEDPAPLHPLVIEIH